VNTMTAAVPAAKLAGLSTDDLIAQYELAMDSRTRYFATDGSKRGGHSRQQCRIDRIVDMLGERADSGDATACAWFQA